MKDMIHQMIELDKNKINLLKKETRPKMAWVSISTPEEIIYAAGAIPFRIAGKCQKKLSEATAFLHHNQCSYVLGCLTDGLEELQNLIEGIVIVDDCNPRRRLYDVWAHNLKPKFSYLIELPKSEHQLSRDYLKTQLMEFKQALENYFARPITQDDLAKNIEICNQSRRLLQQLYHSRKASNPWIRSSDVLSIVKASMNGFKKDFNNQLQELLTEAESKKFSGATTQHRVLICGSYFDHNNIVDVIEGYGASVVCEDISNGLKYIEGEIDEAKEPLDAITDYYFERASQINVMNSEGRVVRLKRIIEEYNIQSVIYFSLKFCDSNLMDFPYIRRELLAMGMPVLLIEGEQQMTNIESIKTRIMTFLETQLF